MIMRLDRLIAEKVYETVDHPAARALTGYLLVRRRTPGRLREGTGDGPHPETGEELEVAEPKEPTGEVAN